MSLAAAKRRDHAAPTRIPAVIMTVVLGAACSGGSGPAPADVPRTTTDPAQAELVTADLERFWAAYDAGATARDFDRLYLAASSPGLRDFQVVRGVTASELAAMVAWAPRYFADIRARSRGIASDGTLDRVRAAYARVKQLYPSAVFPRLTLLVGRFSTGGTTAGSGILVGAEFYGRDASTPLDELHEFQRNNVHPVEELPVVASHELVHVLQALAGRPPTSQMTLLQQAFMEGSADFVGELASGGNINRWMFAYGLEHEHALWAEFSGVMGGRDVSGWLYDQGTSTGRPGDLGYFLGYRIAEAYHARAADKAVAVAEILAMKDVAAILRQSGYAP